MNTKVVPNPEQKGWEENGTTAGGTPIYKWEAGGVSGNGSGGGLWEQNGNDIYYEGGNVSVENHFTVGGIQNLSDRGTGTGKLRIFHEDNLSQIISYGTDGANKGQFSFSVSDGGTANEAMVIDGDGNVGIGTDQPLSVLDVKGKLTLSTEGGIDLTGANSTTTQSSLKMYRNGDGDQTGNFCRIRTRGDGAGNAVEMIFDTNSAEAMRIDADGGVTLAHPAKIFGVRTSNNRAIQLIGYDEGTDDVSLVTTNDWYLRNGSFDPILKASANGRVDIPGTLYVNGTPKIGYSELITTLVTLRKATMDETQDIRESLRDAIDELVEGFEQEIAAMPAEDSE